VKCETKEIPNVANVIQNLIKKWWKNEPNFKNSKWYTNTVQQNEIKTSIMLNIEKIRYVKKYFTPPADK